MRTFLKRRMACRCVTHKHHVFIARESVILLVLATKTVRNYLFTSSHVHYRTIEANKWLRLQDRLRSFIRSV